MNSYTVYGYKYNNHNKNGIYSVQAKDSCGACNYSIEISLDRRSNTDSSYRA